MANLQPTYATALTAAVAGMVANQEAYRGFDREVEGTTPIGFGTVVVRGTAAHQCKPGSGGTLYLGIARINPNVRPDESNAYAQYSQCSIVSKGVIWVTAAVTVTAGQQAYFDSAGLITNVATSNTIIPNAVFDAGASAGNLVPLRLN
jgi:hypothetical protein